MRLAIFLVLASTAPGQTLVDEFWRIPSEGGWTFGDPNEAIVSPPGPTDPTLEVRGHPAVRPAVRTSGSNAFTGDWRAREVSSFGIDVVVYATQGQPFREPTLILSNGSCEVSMTLIGQTIPAAGAGWSSFVFPVDYASTTLPTGWVATTGCGTAHDAWNAVIAGVTEVRFSFGDPGLIAVLDVWDIAVDDLWIQEGVGVQVCEATFRNSSGHLGRTFATGSLRVVDNALTVTLAELPVHSFGYLLVSGNLGIAPTPVTPPQGILCLGSPVGRYLGQVQSSGAAGVIHTSIDLTAVPQPNGPVAVMPGQTLYFQGWHRDVWPNGSPGSYFTSTLQVDLQ